jgi:hypothetical protein
VIDKISTLLTQIDEVNTFKSTTSKDEQFQTITQQTNSTSEMSSASLQEKTSSDTPTTQQPTSQQQTELSSQSSTLNSTIWSDSTSKIRTMATSSVTNSSASLFSEVLSSLATSMTTEAMTTTLSLETCQNVASLITKRILGLVISNEIRYVTVDDGSTCAQDCFLQNVTAASLPIVSSLAGWLDFVVLTDDGTLRLFDAYTHEQTYSVSLGVNTGVSIQLAASIGAYFNNEIRIFDSFDLTQVGAYAFAATSKVIAIGQNQPGSKFLVTTDDSDAVYAYEPAASPSISTYLLDGTNKALLYSRPVVDDRLFIATNANFVEYVDFALPYSGGGALNKIAVPGAVKFLDRLSTSKAALSDGQNIYVWDPDVSPAVFDRSWSATSGSTRLAEFYIDRGVEIVTREVGSRQLKIWNAETGTLMGSLTSPLDFSSSFSYNPIL